MHMSLIFGSDKLSFRERACKPDPPSFRESVDSGHAREVILYEPVNIM